MNKSITCNYIFYLYFLWCNYRFGDSADTIYNSIQSTLLYYTSFDHFKELFVVPYIPKKKKKSKIRKLVLKDTRTGIKVTAVETDEDENEDSDLTKTGTNKIATGTC